MSSIFLVGCSVFQSLAKTLVSWFITLRAFPARVLASSSTFGVEADRIGAEIMYFGAMSKKLNGQQWVLSARKASLMLFILLLPQRFLLPPANRRFSSGFIIWITIASLSWKPSLRENGMAQIQIQKHLNLPPIQGVFSTGCPNGCLRKWQAHRRTSSQV